MDYKKLVFFALSLIATIGYAAEYKCEQVQPGVMYYICNKETGKFLNDANGFSVLPSAIWNIDLEKKTISSQKGRYISSKSGILGVGTTWISNATFDEETCVMRDINYNANGYYTISKTLVSYMSESEGALANSMFANNDNARWIIISKEQYDSCALDRNTLKERLTIAIDEGIKVKDLPAPSSVIGSSSDLLGILTPNALLTTLNKAQTYLKEIDTKNILGKYKHSETTILEGCAKLEAATELVLLLTDYYSAAMDEIDEIASLPGATTSASAAAAKVAINACKSKDAIRNAMIALRAECTLLIKATTLKPHDNLTGLLTNHSFDMGDMTGWYSVDNILNPSSLPTINEGDNTIEGGHNRYYYKSPTSISVGSQVYQPVFGLNKGGYRVKASMKPMGIAKEAGLTAYVVPNDVINLNPGDSIDEEVIRRLTSNIGEILRNAKSYSISKDMSGATAFDTVNLDMQLDDESFFIIALGSSSLISSYAADNVRLTYECEVWPSALAKAKEDAIRQLKLQAIGDNSSQIEYLLDSISGNGGVLDKCTTMEDIKSVRDKNLQLISDIKSFNSHRNAIIVQAQLLNPSGEEGRALVSSFVAEISELTYDETMSPDDNKSVLDLRYEQLQQSLNDIATAIHDVVITRRNKTYSLNGTTTSGKRGRITIREGKKIFE